MKYEYITATGRKEIEVDKHFYDILIALDNDEYNSDRRHNRRNPMSLEGTDYEGEWFSDETDLLGDIIRAESYERLHNALRQLTSEQQTLIDRVYFKNEKIIDIARNDGVTHVAIQNRLKKIYDRLKKILF